MKTPPYGLVILVGGIVLRFGFHGYNELADILIWLGAIFQGVSYFLALAFLSFAGRITSATEKTIHASRLRDARYQGRRRYHP